MNPGTQLILSGLLLIGTGIYTLWAIHKITNKQPITQKYGKKEAKVHFAYCALCDESFLTKSISGTEECPYCEIKKNNEKK